MWPAACPAWGKGGPFWLPWGSPFREEQLGRMGLQRFFPKGRTHLRRTHAQPGPGRPRSITISFQDTSHKKQPGLVWLWKSSQGPGAGRAGWLSTQVLDGASPVCYLRSATHAGPLTAPSPGLHVCEVGQAAAACTAGSRRRLAKWLPPVRTPIRMSGVEGTEA